MTALDLLLEAESFGLRLEADGNDLLVRPARNCPPNFADALRTNKAALLELLTGPPFLIVRSEALDGQIVFWTADEAGRDLLMRHGASRGSIWTFAELDRVVRLNPDPEGLNRLHAVKVRFQGRIVDNP